MRSMIAAAVAAGLAALLTAPTAAQAAQAGGHEHGPDSIRYASIRACPKDEARPCGSWRLVMHSGEIMPLPDAQTVAKEANGKPMVYAVAPVAVSGDGQRVAYLTKAGRLAVRTLGGDVRLFPKDALPSVAQYAVVLQLSDDGARLAVQIGGDRPVKTRIYDAYTGVRLGDLPANEQLMGFSGDGDEVLTSAEGKKSTMDLVSYNLSGERLLRGTPPRLVAENGPQALSGDGRTTASLVAGAKPELVLHDLQTGRITGRLKIKLPAGDLSMIDWTGEEQVTLHLQRGSGAKPGSMTIVQIDTATGGVTVRDHYKLLDSFVFAACGG